MPGYVFLESWDPYWNGVSTPNGSQAVWVKGFTDQQLVVGRYGGKCLEHSRAGGTEDMHCDLPEGSITTGQITLGFAWKVSNALSRTLMVLNQAGGTTAQFSIYQNSDGSLSICNGDGGTVLGTSATALIALNTWYYIEVSVAIGNSGSATVALNGTEVINVSGVDTMGAADANVGRITLPEPASTGTMWYDDLYVRDDLTKAGPSRIIYRLPLAAHPGGDFNLAATAAYINPLLASKQSAEITSYIVGDAVSEKQLFTAETLNKLSGTVVRAISLVAFAKTDSGTATADPLVISAGTTLTAASWSFDSTFKFRRRIVAVDPNTTAAWSRAALAAAASGLQITALAGGATQLQVAQLGYEALIPLDTYSTAGGHRYWSIKPTSAYAGTGRPGASVFNLYGLDGEYLRPNSVTSLGGDYPGLPANHTIDGRKDTNWVANDNFSTARLILDFGSNVIAQKVRLGAQNASLDESIRTFTIDYSDDGSTWTTLHTEATPLSAWSSNEIRSFNMADITPVPNRRRQTLILT